MQTTMTTLPAHLNVFEGALYDTRKPGFVPLRENYAKGHNRIKSVADFKASLRSGPYAWPGGYNILYVTSSGELLCSECARKEFHDIANAIKHRLSDGWRVEASCCEAVSADCVKECNAEREENDQIELNFCCHCNAEFGELS